MQNIYKYPLGYPISTLTDNSAYAGGLFQRTLVKIQDSPLDVSFSNNIVPFIMNYPINANYVNNFELVLSFNATPIVDKSIVFTSDVLTLTVTSSYAPSTNQFLTNPTNSSLNTRESALSLALELANDFQFSQYYTVELLGSNSNQIKIKAINSGRQYNIDQTILTNSLLNSNISLLSYSSASEKYNWQLLFASSRFYTEIYAAEGYIGDTVDKTKSILVDTIDMISPNIDSFPIAVNESLDLKLGFALPRNPFNTLISFENLDTKGEYPIVRPYYIAYGLKRTYGNSDSYKKIPIGLSKIAYIAKGGTINKLDEYDYNKYILDTNSTISFEFLTNSPNTKQITRNSIEYLQFYKKSVISTNSNLSIEVTYRFNDNSTTNKLIPINNSNSEKGMLSIDVSPKTVGVSDIETLNNKVVMEYSIRLSWEYLGSITYSQVKSYRLPIYNCEDDSMNIIFLNNYAAWDSIEFRKSRQIEINRTASQFTRPIANSRAKFGFNSKSDAVSVDYNIVNFQEYTVFTDIVNAEQYNWYAELMNSNSIYVWDGSDYRNILITDFEYLYDDNLSSSFLSIKYRYTTDNNNLTF